MNIVDIPKLCGRCKKVYCSKECQIKDWKEGGHKQECMSKIEEIAFSGAEGKLYLKSNKIK